MTGGRGRDERGAMLVVTLILFTVLWFVLLGFANSSVRALRLAQLQVAGDRAVWTAEAGLRLAVKQLLRDPNFRPKDEWVGLTHHPHDRYRVQVFPTASAPVKIPEESLYVLATGRERSGQERRMAAVLRLAGKKKSNLLAFSVFANLLSVGGGSRIDSFDSLVGPSVRGSLANVATNSVAPGSIQLSGGSWIQGTIQVGPGGATGEARPVRPTTRSTNVVWKDWSTWSLEESAMDSPLEYPPVAAPPIGKEDLKVGWQGLTVTPGAYRDLQAAGGGEVRLSGGTYVFRSMKLTGGARLSFVGDQPVTIYVTEDLDLTGGTLWNTSQKPANMTFMLAKDADAKMTGGAQAYAVVYGPEADFRLQGGTDLFGAIVGREVDLRGGASIHYDIDLARNPSPVLGGGGSSGGGGATGATVVSWQRL